MHRDRPVTFLFVEVDVAGAEAEEALEHELQGEAEAGRDAADAGDELCEFREGGGNGDELAGGLRRRAHEALDLHLPLRVDLHRGLATTSE